LLGHIWLNIWSKAQGGEWDLHHGAQTHNDLQVHSLVAEILMQCPQDRAHKVTETACLAITGVMKMTPTVVLEVVLELPPLHVMTDMEAQAGMYKQTCNQQCRPKSTNSGHTTNFRYGA